MNSISSIARSALTFASTRLAQSAHNVANVNTDGFQADRTVGREVKNGGVSATTVPTYGPAPTYERDGEQVVGSNTELVSETVDQIGALHHFQAAIALLKTDQEMTRSLLDIKA